MTTRVLVVDDSSVARMLISDAISSDPEICVVAAAANGEQALERGRELSPDVITLDLEMPVMDGLETLPRLRAACPNADVIMISSLSERGGRRAFEALALGASDYIAKPKGFASREEGLAFLGNELTPRIRALHERRSKGHSRVHEGAHRSAPLRSGPRVEMIAIAASIGGPRALETILPALPRDLAAALVIVQQMPHEFTRVLAERLDRRAAIQVHPARDGATLTPGSAWVASGSLPVRIASSGSHAQLQVGEPEPHPSARASADPLFQSMAQIFGSRCLGMVLSGIGKDGTAGARAIRRVGGHVIAQDEASSTVWHMPGSIVAAGLAEFEADPERLATSIVELSSRD